MVNEVPGVVIAIVIGVVIAALAVGISKASKDTGTEILDDMKTAAESALN